MGRGRQDGPLAGSPAPPHLPCLQKPRSYHGQSLILDSGSMCRKGHSLLLHSPVGTRQASTWGRGTQTHPRSSRGQGRGAAGRAGGSGALSWPSKP